MSTFSHPMIASIDDAINQLEPTFETFAQLQGFEFIRSHEGSYNIPWRWLQRNGDGGFEEIGLVVSLPIEERLARGFYPEIPCTLYVSTSRQRGSLHWENVVQEMPFSELARELEDYLQRALKSLKTSAAR